jgi:hypothetical protein
MDREWIKIFYSECGREVNLAFDTFNTTNNWGLTLATVVIAATIISILKVDDTTHEIVFLYPSFITWFIIIIAWIVMLRFFVRSCIPYVNIHRWNLLMRYISLYLSVPEDHPYAKVLKQNCIHAIKAYYFEWGNPIPMKKLIWDNLKLIYLWFILPVIFLILWGFIKLDSTNYLWQVGLIIFVIPTLCEFYWFVTYPPFKYHPFSGIVYTDLSEIYDRYLKNNP